MKSRRNGTEVEFECRRNWSRRNGTNHRRNGSRRNGSRRNGSDSFKLLILYRYLCSRGVTPRTQHEEVQGSNPVRLFLFILCFFPFAFLVWTNLEHKIRHVIKQLRETRHRL